MMALLYLQVKMKWIIPSLLLYILLFFWMRDKDPFFVTVYYLLFCFISSADLFLTKAKVRQMVLSMPFTRRTIVNSMYAFHFGQLLVISCLFFVAQWPADAEIKALFSHYTIFLYAFTITISGMAFQLWFYFMEDIAKAQKHDMYLSFFFAVCLFIPMMKLLSLWSVYAIFIGPLVAIVICYFTYRSAAKRFEQKEIY